MGYCGVEEAMKNWILVVLAISLTGCAAMKRHPVLVGAVVGVAVGATVAIVTTHNCAKSYEGKAYDGTPPCPK